jgi:hypothetical protein
MKLDTLAIAAHWANRCAFIRLRQQHKAAGQNSIQDPSFDTMCSHTASITGVPLPALGADDSAFRFYLPKVAGYGFTWAMKVPKFDKSAPGGNCPSGGTGGLMDSVAIHRFPSSSATAAE